jgi:acyl-CoA carboxylase subunit beta
LWKDSAAAPTAAAALRVEARQLLRLNIVDAVIPEPDGAQDHIVAARRLRVALNEVLPPLLALSPSQLVAQRRARFRRFGTSADTSAVASEMGE